MSISINDPLSQQSWNIVYRAHSMQKKREPLSDPKRIGEGNYCYTAGLLTVQHGLCIII